MGSSRSIVIGLVLIAGVGFVIWQLAAGETRDAPPAAEPRVETTPEPVAAHPEVAAESQPVAISPRPFREATEVATPAGPATKREPEGRRLKVVLVPEGIAAAGALVDFTPILDGGERAHTTKGLVADSEGAVRLPKFKGICTVRGALRDRCGSANLTAGQFAGFTLELAQGVAALVVDHSDAPQAGVEVILQEGKAWRTPEDRALTGEDGIAHLVPPRRDEDERRRGGLPPRVAVAGPLDEPVEVALDPAKLPENPVKLVLGPTGRVVVRLVTPDGQPFTGDATVEIRKPPTGNFRLNDGPDCARVSAAAGVATFPHVGLAPHLEIAVTPQDPALRKVQGSLDGPRSAKETTVDVVCGGLATTFRGRLLKGDGKPLARAHLQIESRSVEKVPDGSRKFQDTTAGADGRFEIRFDVDPAIVSPAGLTLTILKMIPIGARGSQLEPGQKIALKAPDGLATGIADLGDVIVEELDLIASGMVVSEKETPITQAKIEIASQVQGHWMRWAFHQLSAGTDGSGKFELRGQLDARGSLGLFAEREGWICREPTPFMPGSKDVKIVMVRGGAIAGSFDRLARTEGSVWTQAPIQVSVVKSGATAPRSLAIDVSAIGDPDRQEAHVYDGRFEFTTLAPGAYTVEIYVNADSWPDENGPKPLVTVENVLVQAGQTTRDPRLQKIDLSALLKSRVVKVVDEQGRPLQDVRIGARAAGATGDYAKFTTGSDGKAVVSTIDLAVEILAALKGYRTAIIPQVTGDTTLTLEKAAQKRVTIKLAEGTELPPQPFSLAVSLIWLSPATEKPPEDARWLDPRSASYGTIEFAKDLTATFEVDDAGIYGARIFLFQETARGRSGTLLDLQGKPLPVKVDESGGLLTVPIDRAKLKKRMEKE